MASSARTAASAHRPSSPPSPDAAAVAPGGFALAGPSERPDPATHAYRQDLADIALAGRVIASHYAEPLLRHLADDAPLLASRDVGADVISALKAGDALYMLDCSLGWGWGYAGSDHRVGYVIASALKP